MVFLCLVLIISIVELQEHRSLVSPYSFFPTPVPCIPMSYLWYTSCNLASPASPLSLRYAVHIFYETIFYYLTFFSIHKRLDQTLSGPYIIIIHTLWYIMIIHTLSKLGNPSSILRKLDFWTELLGQDPVSREVTFVGLWQKIFHNHSFWAPFLKFTWKLFHDFYELLKYLL